MAATAVGDGLSKQLAIHGQRGARRHAVGVGGAHHERAEPRASPPSGGRRRCPACRRETSWSRRARRDDPGLVDGGRAHGPHLVHDATRAPSDAACQAASQPASPPPMMRTIGCAEAPRSRRLCLTVYAFCGLLALRWALGLAVAPSALTVRFGRARTLRHAAAAARTRPSRRAASSSTACAKVSDSGPGSSGATRSCSRPSAGP